MFKDAIETVGKVVDASGVADIVIGVAVASVMTARDGGPSDPYRVYRQRLGRAILLDWSC